MSNRGRMTRTLLLMMSLLVGMPIARAQIVDRVYKTDHRIDPAKEKELSVEIDNISFFIKNSTFEDKSDISHNQQ